MAHVEGVHHVGMTVSDLETSCAFYCKYFDLSEIGRWPLSGEKISRSTMVDGADLTCALLATADRKVVVELIEYHSPKGEPYNRKNNDVGAAHICFFVDDLAELVEQLTADGVTLNAPVQEQVEGTPMVYLQDPDGINIEILQPGPGLTPADLLGAGAEA